MRRSAAVLVALAIGFGVVAMHSGVLALAGRPVSLAPAILILQVIIVMIPFLFMVLARITARPPWRVALTLTLALWAYSLFDALLLSVPGRGANVALGYAMLASPIVISVICGVLGLAKKDSVG